MLTNSQLIEIINASTPAIHRIVKAYRSTEGGVICPGLYHNEIIAAWREIEAIAQQIAGED